jgi:hypothetical protein
MRRSVALAIPLVVAVALGWLLLTGSAPHRPNCLVTVTVVGITNDVSGTRHGSFRLTNSGRHTVVLAPMWNLQKRSGEWPTNALPAGAQVVQRTNLVGTLPFFPRSSTLGPGGAYALTLPLPASDSEWRAAFPYLEVLPPMKDAWEALSTRIGLTQKPKGRTFASTEWMNP